MQIKFFSPFILIIIAYTATNVKSEKYLSEKPSFLKPCHFDDADFNSCYATNFQAIFKDWKDGVPGLKSVGKLDPLSVKRVKISQDSGQTFVLHADLHNVIVKGASKAVVKSANINRKTLSVVCKIFVPILRFDSDYKVKGRVLYLNLNGNGKSYFQAENVLMDFNIAMNLNQVDGFTFSNIQKLKVDIKEIGGFNIQLDNLFNGQKELEESANALFNQNWREFYEILRPAIEQTMSTVLEDRLKKIFNFVPSDFFIADIASAGKS